ncbi:uncharacterized protein LOC106459330 [Limulus polyphemus]|uniref:Uncharacterized protein LOC106459330 n=1 Tax=Limulus polyphemus TaxID=6850 RepID=A0ABM1SCY9_LIMPO|nr:uncharacterized protein LOC106459330 [Limulus polyphemus]
MTTTWARRRIEILLKIMKQLKEKEGMVNNADDVMVLIIADCEEDAVALLKDLDYLFNPIFELKGEELPPEIKKDEELMQSTESFWVYDCSVIGVNLLFCGIFIHPRFTKCHLDTLGILSFAHLKANYLVVDVPVRKVTYHNWIIYLYPLVLLPANFHVKISYRVEEIGLYVAKDLELEHEVQKTCEKISENLHIIANEPSLACYRLQEHIHKSLPQMVEIRQEANQVNEDLQGKCFDLDYSLSAVNSMHGSLHHFQNIFELLRNCVFMKQQLDYKESGGSEKKTLVKDQHFSGSFDHTSSVLPNLPTGLRYSASADLRSSTYNPSQKPQTSQH